MSGPRRRRLRTQLFASALAVALAPFVFLVSMSRWEIFQAARTVDGDAAMLDDAVARFERGGLDAVRTLDAARRRQRVRVVAPSGEVLLDVDGALPSDQRKAEQSPGRRQAARDAALSNFFYGPVRPTLETTESDWGPLLARPEFASGESVRFAVGGNVQVHSVARRVSSGEWVHVRGHSRRAVLPEVVRTRQLFKLLSAALGVAVAVAWLAARRLFGPIERLRAQLLERATTAVPRAGLDLGRRDEVGDLADAFNTVLTALAERTRTNEAFLTDLAHELKNPVAAVRTCADLMSQGEVSAERAARLTTVLQQSSQQLDRLVTQFLELARAEAGLPAEVREPVSLAALLGGLQARLGADPRFAHVTWKVSGLDAPTTVAGVATRLERAFGNLLLNALSFAGEGGWVEVTLSQRGGEAVFSVCDSGPGIDAEHLPRLFERFFTTRQERSGTGLGLALTRAIVEAHGGRITAESPPGGGARFTVTLPLPVGRGSG